MTLFADTPFFDPTSDLQMYYIVILNKTQLPIKAHSQYCMLIKCDTKQIHI